MKIEEKVLKSKGLTNKIEFITIESSEQKEEEVRYKNINRKQIRFDLNDTSTMKCLGELIQPYGLKQYIENQLSQSKIALFRIYAEKRLAKRGAKYIRSLYIKHPEKFASVNLSNTKSSRMLIVRGIFIISEEINQKTISLKDDKEDYTSELESFRIKFKKEEAALRQQEAAIKELTFEENENQRLIGASA